MKKYLYGTVGVALAIGLSAYSKPKKIAFPDWYRFQFIFSSYSQAAVENETVTFWGYGIPVSGPGQFSGTCDGTNDKACEIIVPETSTVNVSGIGRRIKSAQAGDNGSGLVSITATTNFFNYRVSGGANVAGWMNKD